jgi:dCTP deaminase
MLKRDVKIDLMEEGIPRPGKISYGVGSYGVDLRIGYKFYVFTPARCAVVDPKNFDKNAFVEVDITPRTDHIWKEEENGENRCVGCGVWSNNKFLSTYTKCFTDGIPDHVLIPPNSFVLGETVETIEIPRDCIGIVVGKSTYARCGIGLVCTPIEPEWRGKIVIEIANHTPLPAKVYAGEGIGQLMVFRSDGDVENIRYVLKGFCETLKLGSNIHLIHVKTAAAELLSRITTMERPEDKNGTCEKSYADKKAGGGRYQNQTGITLPKVD